jgi:hypothetical protein
MDQPKSPVPDPLIDEVRETQARLVREHGGLRGWVAYLQEQQRKHPEKSHQQSKTSNGGSK